MDLELEEDDRYYWEWGVFSGDVSKRMTCSWVEQLSKHESTDAMVHMYGGAIRDLGGRERKTNPN
jgi:hypothetical protein